MASFKSMGSGRWTGACLVLAPEHRDAHLDPFGLGPVGARGLGGPGVLSGHDPADGLMMVRQLRGAGQISFRRSSSGLHRAVSAPRQRPSLPSSTHRMPSFGSAAHASTGRVSGGGASGSLGNSPAKFPSGPMHTITLPLDLDAIMRERQLQPEKLLLHSSSRTDGRQAEGAGEPQGDVAVQVLGPPDRSQRDHVDPAPLGPHQPADSCLVAQDSSDCSCSESSDDEAAGETVNPPPALPHPGDSHVGETCTGRTSAASEQRSSPTHGSDLDHSAAPAACACSSHVPAPLLNTSTPRLPQPSDPTAARDEAGAKREEEAAPAGVRRSRSKKKRRQKGKGGSSPGPPAGPAAAATIGISTPRGAGAGTAASKASAAAAAAGAVLSPRVARRTSSLSSSTSGTAASITGLSTSSHTSSSSSSSCSSSHASGGSNSSRLGALAGTGTSIHDSAAHTRPPGLPVPLKPTPIRTSTAPSPGAHHSHSHHYNQHAHGSLVGSQPPSLRGTPTAGAAAAAAGGGAACCFTSLPAVSSSSPIAARSPCAPSTTVHSISTCDAARCAASGPSHGGHGGPAGQAVALPPLSDNSSPHGSRINSASSLRRGPLIDALLGAAASAAAAAGGGGTGAAPSSGSGSGGGGHQHQQQLSRSHPGSPKCYASGAMGAAVGSGSGGSGISAIVSGSGTSADVLHLPAMPLTAPAPLSSLAPLLDAHPPPPHQQHPAGAATADDACCSSQQQHHNNHQQHHRQQHSAGSEGAATSLPPCGPSSLSAPSLASHLGPTTRLIAHLRDHPTHPLPHGSAAASPSKPGHAGSLASPSHPSTPQKQQPQLQPLGALGGGLELMSCAVRITQRIVPLPASSAAAGAPHASSSSSPHHPHASNSRHHSHPHQHPQQQRSPYLVQPGSPKQPQARDPVEEARKAQERLEAYKRAQEDKAKAVAAEDAARRAKAAEQRAAVAGAKERRRAEIYALNAILAMCDAARVKQLEAAMAARAAQQDAGQGARPEGEAKGHKGSGGQAGGAAAADQGALALTAQGSEQLPSRPASVMSVASSSYGWFSHN